MLVSEVAGADYATLLNELLDDAHKTTASLEGRASGVITTSGALVTLLFGFVAVASTTTHTLMPSSAVGHLAIALVFIVIASAFAILVTLPLVFPDVSTGEMERLTEKPLWVYADRIEATRMIARSRVKTLRWTRRVNTAKGIVLAVAMVAEVVGIGFVALTVIAVGAP